MLELTCGRSTVRYNLLQGTVSTLGRLGAELNDVDLYLEAERLRLAREWRRFEVALNFGRLQHKHAHAEAEESLAAAREAHDRALEEARAADCRREAAKKRGKELQASYAALERQVQARKAALAASVGGPSTGEARLRTLEDMLALEALEQSLERERLEVMERQVPAAEDALACREAEIQGAVDERVVGVHKALTKDYCRRLKLQESRFYMRRDGLKGEADGLKKKLAAAERCEKATMDTQTVAEDGLSFLYR